MRYLLWILLPLLFLFFVTLAVKNTDPVTVRYFLGNEWRVPLIAALLAFLVVGVVLGFLAMLRTNVRQRREIASLKRELSTRGVAAPVPPADIAAP